MLSQMAGVLPGSAADAGAMTGAVNEIAGVSLTVPSSLQHWYNGTTTLKYNACAYQGETLNGNYNGGLGSTILTNNPR